MIVLIWIGANIAHAQDLPLLEPIFLDQPDPSLRDTLIAQVLRVNPQLHVAMERAQAARSHMKQAGAWNDPEFGVELYNTPVTSFNPIRDGEETDVFLQQMIPWPGKQSRMRDAAGAAAGVLDEGIEEDRRHLISAVKRAYVELFAAQRRIDVNDSMRLLVGRMIDAAATEVSVGKMPQADMLKLRIELSSMENERAILEHDAHVPEAWINTLRDAPMESLGRVPDLGTVPFSFNVHALVDSANKHRHALKQADMEITMARAEQSATSRERLPDFNLRAMYKHMATMTDSYALMAGITLPFAPWVSGKYDAREEEQEHKLRAAEAMRHDKANMVEFEVHDAWVRAGAHWQESERYRKIIVPQAEQVFQSSLAAYQTGRLDFMSLLDSFRTLRTHRMAYFSSVADYMMHVADLEEAVGITLDGGAQ